MRASAEIVLMSSIHVACNSSDAQSLQLPVATKP